MKTAILTIGTEILFGQIVNTNAAYLSEQLQNIGIDVMYHYTVGDNPGRLKELLDIAYRDCDLILTTGGLGPTQDDLTKQVICEYFEDEMVLNEDVEKWLRDLFTRSGYGWTDNNLRQAYFPSRAKILDNPHGTAPGFRLEKNGKVIMAMPGPPREMKPMFNDHVRPYLEAHTDGRLYYKIVKTMGIGESSLEDVLMPLIDGQTDPTFATYAKDGECAVRVTSKRATIEEAKAAVEQGIKDLDRFVGEYVYSYDNEDIADVVGKTLLEKNITISCAESCTAGLFAATLAGVPGISKVFERGIVTYTARAKMEELSVSEETIKKYSTESAEVTKEMVKGLYEKTGSKVCIAITGVAGPDDMSPEKPAGLAYIGICYKGAVNVIEMKARNISRNVNRNVMVLRMMKELYKVIR